jgi:hypothetical protein
MARHILRGFFLLSLSSLLFKAVWAQPANVWQVKDCFSGNATGRATKLNVTSVYAQILDKGTSNAHLNLTLLGQTGQNISGEGGGNLGKQTSASWLSSIRIHILSLSDPIYDLRNPYLRDMAEQICLLRHPSTAFAADQLVSQLLPHPARALRALLVHSSGKLVRACHNCHGAPCRGPVR